MAKFVKIILLLLISNICSAGNVNDWKAAENNGCKVFDYGVDEAQKMEWKGACKNNLVDGYGEMSWTTNNKLGMLWTGYFIQGYPKSLYIKYAADSPVEAYEGEYDEGKHHGYGRLTLKNGVLYTGDFKNGVITGIGILRQSDGSVYYGSFLNGKFNGPGKVVTASGVYKGNFVGGVMEGYGSYVGVGESYSGEWSNGKRNGWGVLTLGGIVNYGSFKNNSFDGNITTVYSNGKSVNMIVSNGKVIPATVGMFDTNQADVPKFKEGYAPDVIERFTPISPPIATKN